MDHVRPFKHNHRGNDTAVGMARHVCARNSELAHQAEAIVSLIHDAHGRRGVSRAHVAAAVVADEAVARGQRRLVHQGQERIWGDAAVDQDDRFSGPAGLILDDPVAQVGLFHRTSPVGLFRWRSNRMLGFP